MLVDIYIDQLTGFSPPLAECRLLKGKGYAFIFV